RQPVIAVNASARHVNRHALPRRYLRKRQLKTGDPLFLRLAPEGPSVPCDPPSSPGFPPFCALRQSTPCARAELPGRSCTGPYSEVRPRTDSSPLQSAGRNCPVRAGDLCPFFFTFRGSPRRNQITSPSVCDSAAAPSTARHLPCSASVNNSTKFSCGPFFASKQLTVFCNGASELAEGKAQGSLAASPSRFLAPACRGVRFAHQRCV